ncbi:glycoside hydrolase [Stereum hirsutum FP-91666 SS1]|uniref:glycoside hydrolase n=1 Tax=Stereum hirsutum (strain FP-91666) TaxID=721885 RepID=UPI0004449E00|nr:glycoside hydrolase [Stereum hirsutum FP-91666 SS1]EIM84370.1 glycoside hydrolase [Stereum hirsutum FP-91666 SS1]
MRLLSAGLLTCGLLSQSVVGQQIWDVWQTTWDRTNLFTNVSPSSAINFVTPGTTGSADIIVDDSTVHQTVDGFGATLTDSSAELLYNLKVNAVDTYWSILGQLFDPTDGVFAAGITTLRVPIGATDFSDGLWSYDPSSSTDTTLASFSVANAPSYYFTVLTDIASVNSLLKIMLCPWSPPGWMKEGTMDGGTFNTDYASVYANYLLKVLQAFKSKGFTVYSLSIQNEPQNNNPTYPSVSMPVATMAAIGEAVRTLMNSNGFSSVKLIGYEHNWDNAATYPVQLMEAAESSFDGVSFHCYEGTYDQMASFTSAYPDKEIWQTECTGQIGTDWWSNIKWYMDELFIGSLEYGARSAMMWNLALDSSGGPFLSGSNSCSSAPCQGVVTLSSTGYTLNEEFYSIAQATRAIIPKDAGGPWGQRIGVSVANGLDWALRVGAYQTERLSSSDWNKYSLVVLNWDDSSSTTFNPVSVAATIEFRGMQASYTFPVGVTTLWWYAAPTTTSKRSSADEDLPEIFAENNGTRLNSAKFRL